MEFHGGPSSPELPALRFPATRRVGVEVGTSVVLLGSWRGCCAAWPGLRCGGAAWSRRRRGSARRGCTGAAARVCGSLWLGGEGAGGSPGANYRLGGDPGPPCCWARARSPAGRSGSAGALEKEGTGEGDDRRARAVSGGGEGRRAAESGRRALAGGAGASVARKQAGVGRLSAGGRTSWASVLGPCGRRKGPTGPRGESAGLAG